MKYEDVTTIENGLKAMLEDEEKGIAEYEKKITEASRLGAFTTAMELQKIKQQESAHADMLRILIGRAEFAKFGMLPGQETGAVMEDRGEARFVRPPLKEMPKVPGTRLLPAPRLRVGAVRESGCGLLMNLRQGHSPESRYSGVQRRARY
uniref:Uncharacterized protein n=1 Tax=viral metagenome TaxID=1070528 RepID=A0A6H1ZWZ1_9ZZZZ